MPVLYIAVFHVYKNDYFQIKENVKVFLFLLNNYMEDSGSDTIK